MAAAPRGIAISTHTGVPVEYADHKERTWVRA